MRFNRAIKMEFYPGFPLKVKEAEEELDELAETAAIPGYFEPTVCFTDEITKDFSRNTDRYDSMNIDQMSSGYFDNYPDQEISAQEYNIFTRLSYSEAVQKLILLGIGAREVFDMRFDPDIRQYLDLEVLSDGTGNKGIDFPGESLREYILTIKSRAGISRL